MGKVLIENLKVAAVIGTLADERLRKQELIFEVEFESDFSQAARTDDFNFAVDYSAVEVLVVSIAEAEKCFLLETLLTKIGNALLVAFPGMTSCRVKVSKPAASGFGAMISCSENFYREK